jgi:hypothetical protein
MHYVQLHLMPVIRHRGMLYLCMCAHAYAHTGDPKICLFWKLNQNVMVTCSVIFSQKMMLVTWEPKPLYQMAGQSKWRQNGVCAIFWGAPLCVYTESIAWHWMVLVATAILLDPHATLSDHLLHAVLLLLHKEVSDHGRHLPHYFSLFHMYASLGVPERTQLLKVSLRTTRCLQSMCMLNSLMQHS